MAYTHITMKGLGWIEVYHQLGLNPSKIAKKLGRSNQPIYNVVNFLKGGGTIVEYLSRYKRNKSKCGAKKKTFKKNRLSILKVEYLKAGHQMLSLVEMKEILVARSKLYIDDLKTALSLM